MIIGNCPVCGAEMRVGTDMTNADRIRAMTDEELSELFWIRADCELCPNKEPYCSDDCKKHWLEWLREEANDGKSE